MTIYDINVISLHGGLENFANGEALTHHYRVFKQSEKIKNSDPVGVGLAAVAIAVVFLALICIALILQGSGKLMKGLGEDKKKLMTGKALIRAITDGLGFREFHEGEEITLRIRDFRVFEGDNMEEQLRILT